MIEKLQTYASGRRVLVLFVITLAVYFLILFYSIPAVLDQAPEMRLFDMSPGGYSHADAEKLLNAIGPDGRETYLKRQLPIDFIYPGLFAVTYTLMLVWLFRKRYGPRSKVFYLTLIPAGAGLFDYLENIGIIVMLTSFPNIDPKVVLAASTFSIGKSILTILFYLLLGWGLLALLFRKRGSRRSMA